MSRKQIQRIVLTGLIVPILMGALYFLVPQDAFAGIYSENSETVYQENWIPHSQYDGNCHGFNPNWFIEPWECEKSLSFTLPNLNTIDNLEIYIDLWRNHDEQVARFRINNGPTYAPNVGDEWSRTPYIHEFSSAELATAGFQNGSNTITFWDDEGGYHIHDVAIRIYSNSAEVTTTEGRLHNIQANGVNYDPYLNIGGNSLNVASDELLISAEVDGNAKYVEFHAYYDGYDEDNDGDFVDWHNLNHNNWNPGGSNQPYGQTNPNPELGGTINHIQTVAVNGPGIYTGTWTLPHIVSQSNVRFKVRIVDDNQYVRDAAGGDSRNFTLSRPNQPSLYAIIPDFNNFVLHHGGTGGFPDVHSETIILPNIDDFDSAYIIGAYWSNLYITINDSPQFAAFPGGGLPGRWDLSITNGISNSNTDPYNYLQEGENTITYYYFEQDQYGSFIENPGPMIVLKRENSQLTGADTTPPDLFRESPKAGSTFVSVDTNISFNLFDADSGVDTSSISLQVNGNSVLNPVISNGGAGTLVFYDPPTFDGGETITIEVEACDNAGNCIDESYSFSTELPDLGFTATSDDFNVCSLDSTNADWTFVNPLNDGATASIDADYQKLEIFVPGGSEHDLLGTNYAPRVIQPALNTPAFLLETRFTTVPTQQFQIQGLLVEASETEYIRFDMYHNGTSTQLFAASVSNNSFNFIKNDTVPITTRFLRINRDESNWQFFYSLDGTTWEQFHSFTDNIVVENVGVYAGNAGSSAPAYTAKIDYFFDLGNPISGEEDDDYLFLPVDVDGNGSVEKSIECGKPVTLTAVPDLGWEFDRWTGAASGTNPEVTVTDLGTN